MNFTGISFYIGVGLPCSHGTCHRSICSAMVFRGSKNYFANISCMFVLLALLGWLFVCLFVCLFACLLACLLAWLISWLIDWLIDWLIGWLVDRLIGWLVGRLIASLLACLFSCLIGHSASQHPVQNPSLFRFACITIDIFIFISILLLMCNMLVVVGNFWRSCCHILVCMIYNCSRTRWLLIV